MKLRFLYLTVLSAQEISFIEHTPKSTSIMPAHEVSKFRFLLNDVHSLQNIKVFKSTGLRNTRSDGNLLAIDEERVKAIWVIYGLNLSNELLKKVY